MTTPLAPYEAKASALSAHGSPCPGGEARSHSLSPLRARSARHARAAAVASLLSPSDAGQAVSSDSAYTHALPSTMPASTIAATSLLSLTSVGPAGRMLHHFNAALTPVRAELTPLRDSAPA